MKSLLRFFVCAILTTSFLVAQAPPLAVPFIEQLSPASLAPGATTLTLTGANFSQNAVVTIAGPGVSSTQSTSTTVNSSGTQIVAAFPSSPATSNEGTLRVTVTNPSGEISNAVYLSVTAPTATVNVHSDSMFSYSAMPAAVVAGDFNNDGITDLAVANLSGSISILLGNTNGTLSSGNTYQVNGGAAGIASGDFNGDGKLDLVVANAQAETLTILLSNGDGTFTVSPSNPATGAYPASIVAADFNGDGKLDLAVVNMCGITPSPCYPTAAPQGPFPLTILLGNGDGTFTASPTPPMVGKQPSYMTLGDFNADGLIDLAVSNMGDNTVTILMGNGDGTFTPTTTPPTTGNEPQGIVAADFNGDGALDLAVVNQIDGTVSILINQNCASVSALNCTFTTPKAPSRVGNSPVALATADMNGDGILDLVVANSADNTISALLGNGSGSFTAVTPQNPQNFATPARPNSLALADVNGDGRVDVVAFGGGYSVILQSTVAAVSLTASNSPVMPYGQQLYLTATVARPPVFPFLPTGTVTFMDGATSLATVSIDSLGHAVYQSSTLSTGTHQITAVYSGDYFYTSTTSPALTQTILQAQGYTVLSSSANPSGTGQGVAFVATIQIPPSLNATGTVTFQDLTTSTNLGTATVSGNSAQVLVSNLAAGTHSIQATYSGDTNFAGSTSHLNQTVNQATTTLSLSSSLSTSSYSQAVTLTATVQPSYTGGSATGSVSFYDNGSLWQTAPVLNNVAQITVTGFAVGSHSLTATYGGNSNFTGSSAPAVSLVVNQAATTVTLVSNANPSQYGQSVTYTATVGLSFSGSTPSGAITFYDGATVLWSGFLSKGSAQYTISTAIAGSHPITAQYGGTANFTASTSSVLTQTVNQCPTTLIVSTTTNPSSYGQSVTLYANLQTNYNLISNGGTVTFSDNGTQLGTATIQGSNNTVTITTSSLGVGSRTITATYSGDSNLLPSTGTLAETVNPAATTTTIASSSYNPAFGQSITLTANVRPTYGNTPTGSITFMDRTTTLGTVPLANNTASFSISTLSAGTHYISAQYSGDTYSAASSSAQTLVTVAPPPTTTLLTSSVNPSGYNQPVTYTATLQLTSSGTPTGTVTFYDGTTSMGTGTVANGAAQLTISGSYPSTHSITATYSGDSNFSGSTSTALSQVVNPGPTTTTVTSLDSPGTVGYNVRFMVSTTATYGGGPTGNITLYDGTTTIGSGTLPGSIYNNSIEIVVSGLTVGSHSITAKYSGTIYYAASTSSPFTEVMNLPATSTYLATGINPVPFGQTLALTATVQPPGNGTATGTVTFLDGATTLGTATVANNLAQLNISTLSVGTHTLTAKYSGDSNFAGSTSPVFNETVNQAATTTVVSSNNTQSPYGQSVTFTATVAPNYGNATGTITFLDGTTSLATLAISNGAAQLTLSTLSAGTHSITAKYSGDTNFTASTSAVLSQTINPATTTTTLVTNPNPSTYGQSVTLTATIQPPAGTTATGTVAFVDGSTSIGSATLSANSAQISVATLIAGTHSITAVYSGDSNMASSTSTAVSQQVNRASTITNVGSTSNPSVFGQSVTLTAAVQPPAGTTATGTVTFMDGATAIGTANLSANSAQISVASLAAGTHSVTAVYSGDSNMTGSTSTGLSQQVNQAATTTSLASSANPSVFSQAVTFTATVQPPSGTTATGTVTFMDGSTSLGSAPLSGNSAQFTVSSFVSGTHSITAVYSGDSNMAASTSASLSQQVNQASTTTALSSGLNPSSFGQAVTFTATVQPPSGITATGTVTFMDGSTSLGSASLSSNSAQISVPSLAVGTHSITATYAGNGNLLPSTSTTLTQTVNGEATTTTVTSGTNPSSSAQSIILSATIQPAFGGNITGSVTFLDGTTTLGTSGVSSNSAQLSISSLSVGPHSITAKYSGDSNYVASTSTAFTQTVNQAAATTAVSANLNPAAYGRSVTFTVSVQSSSGTPTGTVTLVDGSASLGSTSLSSGTAQFTIGGLSLGSHSITATYSGDSNFSGSTSSSLTEVVNQAATTTSVSSNLNPSTYGQSITFTATVVPSSGSAPSGTVAFLDGATQIGSATLSGGVASFTTSATALSGGSHSITATYSGDSNFTASTSSPLAQIINAVATVTVLTSNLNPSVAGQSVTFTASISSSVSGSQSGTVNFYLDGSTTPAQSSPVSGNAATYSTSSLTAGAHSVSATFVSSSSNFQGSSSTTLTQSVRDFSVSASPTSRTISRNHSGTYTLTVTPVNGFTGNVALSCSGVPTNVTCSPSPTQVTLNGTSSLQSTFTVTVGKNATTGTVTLTLTGTSGSDSHKATVSLTIN